MNGYSQHFDSGGCPVPETTKPWSEGLKLTVGGFDASDVRGVDPLVDRNGVAITTPPSEASAEGIHSGRIIGQVYGVIGLAEQADQSSDQERRPSGLRIRRLGLRVPSSAPGQEAVELWKRRSTVSSFIHCGAVVFRE
jgi:hypothetical protein